MAEPKSNEWMERIVSLCKRRGFIYQSSELYGGLNGFWDYGPLGAELKRNVKDLWRPFNLMFKTTVGPVAPTRQRGVSAAGDGAGDLRPVQERDRQFPGEGAVWDCADGEGVSQRGHAAQFHLSLARIRADGTRVLHSPRRTGGEAVRAPWRDWRTGCAGCAGEPQPNWGWEAWHKYWVEQRMAWYESIGLPRSSLEEYWQTGKELAHYAKATVDILYRFPFGLQELEGIAARGDFDLTQHQKCSGKSLEYFDEETRTKYLPHVIEPSAGVDRLVLALICNAYSEDEAPDEKGKLERRVVSAVSSARGSDQSRGVSPAQKPPRTGGTSPGRAGSVTTAHDGFLRRWGAIGRRYRRQDEIGTPFGVTIDFDTWASDPNSRTPSPCATATPWNRNACPSMNCCRACSTPP
jgi:glycyl-tRNA synthetase